jgi:hypothetical protein
MRGQSTNRASRGSQRTERQEREHERDAGGGGQDNTGLDFRIASDAQGVNGEPLAHRSDKRRAGRFRLHGAQLAAATDAVRKIEMPTFHNRRKDAAFAFADPGIAHIVV